MSPKIRLIVGSIIVNLLSAPVSSEVIAIKENGFSLSNSITVEKSVQESWAGLTENVHQWWPDDHTWWGKSANLTIDAHAGGCFCEVDGDRSAEHMRISYVDPNKLMRMTGGLGPLQGMGLYGALDWQFEALEDNKTKITLSYKVSGIMDKETYEGFVDIVDKVQAIQLGGLGKFLSNKDG